MGKPRKRMTRFRIDEISQVDEPAQEGARAVLTKGATELDVFNKWMGDGARRVSSDEDEAITLELNGERRTFFADGPNHNHYPTPDGLAQLVRASKKLEARADAMLVKRRVPAPGSFEERAREALREEGERMRAKFQEEQDEEQETDMTTKDQAKAMAKQAIAQDQLRKQADAFRKAYNEAGDRRERADVIRDDPEGFRAFQAFADQAYEDDRPSTLAEAEALTKAAELDTKINKAIGDIMERDVVASHIAMSRARSEHPELFHEWNNA